MDRPSGAAPDVDEERGAAGYASIRDDPRIPAIVRGLGLPDGHPAAPPPSFR